MPADPNPGEEKPPVDPKVAAYYAAAEAITPPPLTPEAKATKIRRLKGRLEGVQGQFVEQGQLLKKAKASKDNAAQGACETVLDANLKLRRQLVGDLRKLGDPIRDPLVD